MNLKDFFSDELLKQLTFFDYEDSAFPTLCAYKSFPYQSQVSIHIPSLPCFLFLYVKSGEGILDTDNHSFSVKSPSLFFLRCTSDFYLKNISVLSSFDMFFIQGEILLHYLKQLSTTDSYYYSIPAASTIPASLNNLVQYMDSEQKERELIQTKCFIDILTEMCLSTLLETKKEIHIPAYLRDMKQLFDEFYYTELSLVQLEEKFEVNRYRLCREFKQYYQISPLQYLNRRRIEIAKTLLLTTNLNIHEIGSAVGIDNTNHFINLFKKQTGTTPLAYKRSVPDSIRALHSLYKSDNHQQ